MTKELEAILRMVVFHSTLPLQLYDLSVKIIYDSYECWQDGYYDDYYEAIDQEIDNQLIYNDDQWLVMSCYQIPTEANWMEAIQEYTTDLVQVFEKFMDERKQAQED